MTAEYVFNINPVLNKQDSGVHAKVLAKTHVIESTTGIGKAYSQLSFHIFSYEVSNHWSGKI